jgi:hypothetical protein
MVRKHLIDKKGESIFILNQAVRWLEEEILEEELANREDASLPPPSAASPSPKGPSAVTPIVADVISNQSNAKVFVVHGHDEGAREGVARFLERVGLEAIILHEKPNQGRAIIEKFEVYAR